MYLKNLTVLGFKSFADKTSLNFQPGVTAIVGPNGCGKSNVSDAIRWVLGEQSAKALRGGEMADVIFNGTDGRKPLGMAEVSLTIGGVDAEHLHAAGVEVAYNEVTVTRRVFRDGGSEYFINKTPCRLKDIQQLFMGTGVGRTSYSIMAQGNITQILSSKPEDRRMIFEEAAGITKFKTQKKEALRKLESTDQNLLRVADLVREVKRQIGSLQRQAGKARRYKQISQELQHLETQHARHQFDVFQAELAERHQLADQLRVEIETTSASVLQHEDEIIQLRERLSELDHQISSMQQRGLELKGESDRHASQIAFNEERLQEFASQNSKALADMTQAEERRQIAQNELEGVTAQLAASQATLQKHRETLVQRQEALRELEESIKTEQDKLRQAQADAFAAAQNLSRARNEINALDIQKQGNVARLEKLSAEKIQLEEERSRLEGRLKDFAANVEAQKLNAISQRGSVEERQRRLVEIQEQLAVAAREQDRVLQSQAEKRSRLDVLEQLASGHEGFSAGSLAALKQSEHVLGSLADRIRVPAQFVTAIETALGHHLQLVLTQQPESAQKILADLNTGRKGRASVAALSFNAPNSAAEPSLPDAAGAESDLPVTASSVVESDAEVRGLIETLLGQTRIVRDLETATAAWRANPGAHNFVTLTGELLSRHGIYTGGWLNGAGEGKAAASILGRKNEIIQLQGQLEILREEVAGLSKDKGALMSEQTELQASLQEAQKELRVQEVAIATREGEVNALQSSLRLLHQKIDTVVFEVQSLAAQEEEGQRKRADLVSAEDKLAAEEEERQGAARECTARVEDLRHQREGAHAQLTESKVALATDEQMCSSFQHQAQALRQRIAELGQLIEQRRSELGSFVSRKEQAEMEIQTSRAQIEKLSHERERVNAEAGQLIAQKDAQESEIQIREESLREVRKRLSDMQHGRGTIEVEIAQKNMGVQNLRERIQQKYHLNLDDIRSECITITYAEDGPPKVHTLSPEEMAAAGAGTDWTEVSAQIEVMQKRLDEMGPVNLVAIEEYEETEQRHQFLSQQHDDLVSAKAQLLEVINRINTQTREMFKATFEQIRENFRIMFTEVFNGGKADLVLLDENDVLESGIDIVARPPGKQLQTISLLSGGEQTMTAVSLLFSIYQVKPSPFCVLDELDAPLDESNINRFIRVLQRFLAHSQFIIITHNKRTISMADVLYGVTMQEHGVSRIVSVKFHRADEGESGPAGLDTPTKVKMEQESPQDADELVMAK